jgi:ketosteroid isomerase-like protein
LYGAEGRVIDLPPLPTLRSRDTARAMSQENVELARAVIDGWNRGDYDAWIEAFDDDCEFRPLRAQLEGRPYRGHDGLRQFAHDLTLEWRQVRFALNEIRDVGDQVVVLARFHARGRASGADLDVPIGVVGRVREGKITEARMFSDPDEALKAAGLQG